MADTDTCRKTLMRLLMMQGEGNYAVVDDNHNGSYCIMNCEHHGDMLH
jgi:hypothetical protein